MKFSRSTDLLKLAWLASISLPTASAQTTGGSNKPPEVVEYELTAITGVSNLRNLPLNLSTSLKGKPPVPGTPTAVPNDTDIKWSGSAGEPTFSPSSGGSSVEIDFTRPFVKTTSDAATKFTASYSPSASSSSSPGSSLPPPSVTPSSQTKDLDRIYLDFWVADTEDTKDDFILVRPTTSQLETGQKTVLHWAKVTVKHNRGQALKLKITNSTSSGKPLYFLDQEEDPNPQTKDPALTSELEKEFDEGKFFWVGSAEKGEGEGKFKVQGDLGSGYKDAPEEKTVKLVPVEIKEISFAGSNYHELKSDDGNKTYDAPQWLDGNGDGQATTSTSTGDKNYPVSFTRNTNPIVGAMFSIHGLPNNLAIKLRAKGSDGIKIPETAAQVNGNDVTLPVTASDTSWPNMIKFYDRNDANKAFKLDWEIKVGDSDWAQVASTKHQVYLTLNDPVTALRQETLFYLSAKNADGDNAEASARNSMFGEFTDLVVTRLDGVQMTYWMNNAMGCTDTPDLLSSQDGNGNCQSWGGFFRDMLRIHGITADRIRVWPKAGDSSVIVKNWQFNQPPSGPPQHPYIENLDAFDLAGIPGQGNLNPPGSFNGHWITKSGGLYYDPSYGTTAISGGNADKTYEDGAFDGFGEQYRTSTGAVIRGIRKNNSGNTALSEVDYFLAN
jgi:hypothetical protein